jgi:hypothetical protein
VWLALAGLIGLPDLALASCPAFDMERSVIGAGGRGPRGGPTRADFEVIMKGGLVVGMPVGLWPPSGPAPLRVGLRWMPEAPKDPLAIELDADGDGRPKIVDTREENFGHTYTAPGHYAATVRVRGRDGRIATYPVPVTVLSRAAFEAELQGRWATMKAALLRRDHEAALECVWFGGRDKLVRDLEWILRTGVERTMPPLRFVDLPPGSAALFAGLRPIPGNAKPLEVYFAPDYDGVWRVVLIGNLVPQP